MNNQQLNEGLRPMDLEEMVYPTFEVDTYSSKMGEDRDVCVVSFQVKDRAPAKDLMEFIEKGYHFVLDSDVSSGENADGEYSVFVELPRSSRLAEQIKEFISSSLSKALKQQREEIIEIIEKELRIALWHTLKGY
jgi:hypothetical protein